MLKIITTFIINFPFFPFWEMTNNLQANGTELLQSIQFLDSLKNKEWENVFFVTAYWHQEIPKAKTALVTLYLQRTCDSYLFRLSLTKFYGWQEWCHAPLTNNAEVVLVLGQFSQSLCMAMNWLVLKAETGKIQAFQNTTVALPVNLRNENLLKDC